MIFFSSYNFTVLSCQKMEKGRHISFLERRWEMQNANKLWLVLGEPLFCASSSDVVFQSHFRVVLRQHIITSCHIGFSYTFCIVILHGNGKKISIEKWPTIFNYTTFRGNWPFSTHECHQCNWSNKGCQGFTKLWRHKENLFGRQSWFLLTVQCAFSSFPFIIQFWLLVPEQYIKVGGRCKEIEQSAERPIIVSTDWELLEGTSQSAGWWW